MDPTQWNLPYPAVVASLFVIVMLRAGGTYLLGRAASAGAQRTRLAKLMASERYQKAHARVEDYGALVVAASFLTIGVQTLVNLAAGAMGMSLRRYLPALVAGSVLWAFLYATIGTVGLGAFGQLFHQNPALAVGTVLALVGGIIVYVRWRRTHAG